MTHTAKQAKCCISSTHLHDVHDLLCLPDSSKRNRKHTVSMFAAICSKGIEYVCAGVHVPQPSFRIYIRCDLIIDIFHRPLIRSFQDHIFSVG